MDDGPGRIRTRDLVIKNVVSLAFVTVLFRQIPHSVMGT